MVFTSLTSVLLASASLMSIASASPAVNSRRGVVYMPNTNGANNDYQHWTAPLSWYYNYGPTPNQELASSGMTFVPMLWGDKDGFKENFIPAVEKLSGITHILGMNEPDIAAQYGGSDLTVSQAVAIWQQYIEPLAAKGIKLGSPAVSGSPNGWTWINQFMQECTGCTIDFMALHYYGNFEGLASRIGQFQAAFSDKPLWVTEWADSNDALDTTMSNTQQMINYMDSLSYLERYSYFGAVRSDVCNIGANAAFMDANGNLNSLGQMYMSAASSPAGYSAPSASIVPVPSTTIPPLTSYPTHPPGVYGAAPQRATPTTLLTKVLPNANVKPKPNKPDNGAHKHHGKHHGHRRPHHRTTKKGPLPTAAPAYVEKVTSIQYVTVYA